MPGRLRQGTGASDKAQNCCNKCCEYVCRLSPWNRLICYAMVALALGTLVLIIGGAFAADIPDIVGDANFCTTVIETGFGSDTGTTQTGSGGEAMSPIEDPVVPLLNQNAFVWWTANAGIFAIIMVVMTFVCCCSYVTLCCSFKMHLALRIAGVIGFVLVIIAFAMYVVWLGFGSYLLTLFRSGALTNSLCRGMVVYVVLMYIYLFIFIGVVIATVVWTIFGREKEDSKKSRDSAKSNLKMPSKKLITAMV